MDYVFGDYSSGGASSQSSGLDIGYYPAQDVSIDDVYYGSESGTNGWFSAIDKIGNVFGNVVDTSGGIFNSYVDKLLNREVFGSNGINAGQPMAQTNPQYLNNPRAQQSGGIDTKTLVIGGVVLAAFVLIAFKK